MSGTKLLFCSGFLVGDNWRLGGFILGVMPPVRLHKYGVDLFEIDNFSLVPNGFDQRSDAEVFDGSQCSFGEAEDEIDCLVGEGLVRKTSEVELLVDKRGESGRCQGVDFCGVGNTAFEVLLWAELDGGIE